MATNRLPPNRGRRAIAIPFVSDNGPPTPKRAAPKRRRAKQPEEPGSLSVADLAWRKLREDANKKNDGTYITTAQAERLIVGLPMPSLALDYGFASNVYPLGRAAHLTGDYGSCKSALGYELMRWHMVYDGFSALIENENKDAPDLRAALWEYNVLWIGDTDLPEEERNAKGLITFTNSLEEWMSAMSALTGAVTKMNAKPDAKKGSVAAAVEKKAKEKEREKAKKVPTSSTAANEEEKKATRAKKEKVTYLGWQTPYCVMLDSFNGTTQNSELAKITMDGSPGLGYAIDANLISKYVKGWPTMLRHTAMSIIATNHLKPKTDFFGNPESHSPGGRAIKFMESLELEMHKGGEFKDPDGRGGIWLKMVIKKNCVGPTGRSIRFAMVWWWDWDEETQQHRQYAAFDWHSATCHLYEDLFKSDRALYNRLCEVCDVQFASKGMVWSKRLGIKEENAVDRHTLGKIIDTDIGLRESLYPILGIKQRTFFRPGRPLKQTINEATHRLDHAIRDLYQERDLSGFAEITSALMQEERQERMQAAEVARARARTRDIDAS